MNGTDLLRAMSYVDEKYVHAAEEERRRRPGAMLLRFGGLAACAVIAIAGAFLLRRPAPVCPPPTPVPDPLPGATEPAPDIPDRPPNVVPGGFVPSVTVDLSKITINELPDGLPSGCLSADFYLEHEEIAWNEDDIIAWFGMTDFTPAFLPDGLTPAQGSGYATVWTKREDGEVVIDLLHFSARDMDDERIFPRDFILTVSKNNPRPFRDWLHWGETWETCEIAGVEVTVVHAVYSHGPYDPETHTPAGYYDWYDVDFELDGLKYALTAQRLDLEEVAAITASIITGDTNFTVTGGEGAEQLPMDDPPEPPDAAPTPGDSAQD